LNILSLFVNIYFCFKFGYKKPSCKINTKKYMKLAKKNKKLFEKSKNGVLYLQQNAVLFVDMNINFDYIVSYQQ